MRHLNMRDVGWRVPAGFLSLGVFVVALAFVSMSNALRHWRNPEKAEAEDDQRLVMSTVRARAKAVQSTTDPPVDPRLIPAWFNGDAQPSNHTGFK